MKPSSPWKNGIITGFAFFLTVTILSIGYASLNSLLSVNDKVGTGSWLSSGSWNKIVDSILELDGRTTSITSSGTQIKITGGSPGAWKILTSDATGVASWKGGISQMTIDASIPTNQILSGSCDAVGSTLTVTTPGIYWIQVRASAYVYIGNFNNLIVWLTNSLGNYMCVGSAGNSGIGGWMYPGAYCIEHLNAGTYILRVFGSDSSLCTTSRIDKIFDGYAKVRLLSAD